MADPQSSWDDDDDDGELELEPIDPEILAHEKQLAEKRIDEIVKRVDVDEVLGPVGPHSDLGIDLNLPDWRNFRFTTRHLLILTAVLAVVFTIFSLAESCNSICWMAVAALAAGWYWVYRLEQRREAERQKQRAILLKTYGQAVEASESSVALEEPAERGFQFKFAFSLRQLFITMTVTAVLVWILTFIPPQVFSLLLGLIAVAGIVAVIAGFEAPPIVVLAWWLLLVLYMLVSIFAQAKGNGQAASRTLRDNDAVATSTAFI
jgi:hypothetical protein